MTKELWSAEGNHMTSPSQNPGGSEGSAFVSFIRFFTLGLFLSAAVMAATMIFSH
jgi:hypothetical protein